MEKTRNTEEEKKMGQKWVKEEHKASTSRVNTGLPVNTGKLSPMMQQYMEIKEMAESLGYHVVMNDHPEYGQGHSIALGVGACQNNACILMVADMPYLKLDTLKEMVSIQDGKHIVICEYNGILCNPMLLPKRYYGRAKQLCNDKGAKQIIGDDTYLTVSLSEEEFMDIDEKTEAI